MKECGVLQFGKLTLKASNEKCYHTLIYQEGTLLRRAKPCWRDEGSHAPSNALGGSLSLVHHERRKLQCEGNARGKLGFDERRMATRDS